VGADIGQDADPVSDEGLAATNEEQKQEHPVGTVLENWLNELSATEDAFETPDTEIDLLPTVSIARDEDGSGSWPPGVSSISAKETFPIAKAEQNAIRILREAGYRVGTTSEPSQPATVGIERSDGIGGSLEASDLQLLTELCVRRVITATIMEEATRRMRAENSRLEALLARFNEPR
jgi:hypothetical protein